MPLRITVPATDYVARSKEQRDRAMGRARRLKAKGMPKADYAIPVAFARHQNKLMVQFIRFTYGLRARASRLRVVGRR